MKSFNERYESVLTKFENVLTSKSRLAILNIATKYNIVANNSIFKRKAAAMCCINEDILDIDIKAAALIFNEDPEKILIMFKTGIDHESSNFIDVMVFGLVIKYCKEFESLTF